MLCLVHFGRRRTPQIAPRYVLLFVCVEDMETLCVLRYDAVMLTPCLLLPDCCRASVPSRKASSCKPWVWSHGWAS